MMSFKPISLAAALLLATQVNAGTVTTDGADIIIKTKGGFEAKTADGKHSFKIGGRMQLDYNSYDGVINASAQGNSGSDIFFRRARLEIKGHANDWKYGLSYNLTDSGSIDQLNTTYTGFGKKALLTFGQQKENFGLEDTGSSKWITGLERSLIANAFDTGNNLGIKLSGTDDFLSYSVGIFNEAIDSDRALDTAITGRIVIRPIYSDNTILHIGIGATQRNAEDGFDDFDSRLGVRGGSDGGATRYAPQFTAGDGDKSSAYNLELAYAKGPLNIMAEYYAGTVDAPDAVVGSDDLKVSGYYIQTSYVLTGENRSYKTSSAAFDKVKPKNANGAWEVFARYDAMNTDTGNNINLVGGDHASVITLGLNWYMTSNIKMAMNYVSANTDTDINGEGNGDALAARLHLAF